MRDYTKKACNSRFDHRDRHGAVMIVVMVCMLIAMALAVGTLRNSMRSRSETRKERQLRQTALLLDAGILRTMEQLERDKAYRGELWQLPDELVRFGDAEVAIRVVEGNQESDPPQDAPRRTFEVTASITLDGNRATRTQRSLRFEHDG